MAQDNGSDTGARGESQRISGFSDLVITGNISGKGAFFIDGTVIGNVAVENITIGRSGQVAGDLMGVTVQVEGRVAGNIRARTVTLGESSDVQGEMTFEQFSMQNGARFEGRCITRRDEG